ncbi:hypothetical protein B0O80DRAFT_458916 [Mortierella sp. GBAus27b]|nr:hypothetical protein BGX31_007730 [Mortierella sp. GBA43]KAI8350032.1 hypothetical protein B0O80DRAFT_458916 [Mortierella sp. GBAus27b]
MMRPSIATAITIVSVMAMTLLSCSSTTSVSAALTEQEKVAHKEKFGSSVDYCGPCLSKAMHNHFPHACAADLDPTAANNREATPEEDRCVCIAFKDLYWMKADCSAECNYVHSEKAMQYFVTSDKMPGCDKWVNFETGQENVIEGFAPKDPDHKPEAFEIAPPPPMPENEDLNNMDEDGRLKINMHLGFDKKTEAQRELEGLMTKEAKEADKEEAKEKEAKTETKQQDSESKKTEPEAENKKDEL